jgi:plasmid maintenance system antidote protein VapI
VTEDFWLNLQLRWDLYKARELEAKEIKAIRPVKSVEKRA